jgi:hypothetical protein
MPAHTTITKDGGNLMRMLHGVLSHVSALGRTQAKLLPTSNAVTVTVGCRALSRCPQPDCKREIDAAALRSLLTLAEWQAVLDVVRTTITMWY